MQAYGLVRFINLILIDWEPESKDTDNRVPIYGNRGYG